MLHILRECKEGQPTEEQPTEEQPTEEQPTEEQPLVISAEVLRTLLKRYEEDTCTSKS